jgi:hypothetical protein
MLITPMTNLAAINRVPAMNEIVEQFRRVVLVDKSVSCVVRKARYADNANVRKAGNKVTLSTIEAIEEITLETV